MPTPRILLGSRPVRLDARPDRLDLRDFPYRPPVVNLPAVFPSEAQVRALLPGYAKAGMILDQGSEGACTGFGLAAVINYLQWIRALEADQEAPGLVSPRMLYHLAKLYDEWPGEDYEGSSCRGALRGWQRHGVCLESLWPYGGGTFQRPEVGWDTDAAARPLGVYYRIQPDSVVDMQAAIHQAGAIYVSASVHEGWAHLGKGRHKSGALPSHATLPVIQSSERVLGGHAFALVGYNARGFVVQNSWGSTWGWGGFGILPYEDWTAHGQDAWVMGLGVPVRQASADVPEAAPSHFVARGRSATRTLGWFAGKQDPFQGQERTWPEAHAYGHTLVTGNDGVILNRLPLVENALDNVRFVALEEPLRAWQARGGAPRKLVLYAHGGLNSEAESIRRIRVLGPAFESNGIYPLFVTWKSGPGETIRDMLQDSARGLFGEAGLPARGITESLREATDRTLEVAARGLLVRAAWSEMKENVARSSEEGHGLDVLADRLRDLQRATDGELEIHLMGHSAGAFVCGRLLTEFGTRGLRASSCTLFAPACDLGFALEHFRPAMLEKRLPRARFLVHTLSDRLERADNVAKVYGKSLLYLVSRALERWHKTPLLGLCAAFDAATADDGSWSDKALRDLEAWQAFFWGKSAPEPGFSLDGGSGAFEGLEILKDAQVDTGAGRIDSSHGCFDNSLAHIGKSIREIRGDGALEPIGPLDF